MTVRTYRAQKAALTRAVKTGDKLAVRTECRRAISEWESPEWLRVHGTNAWPDDWSRWQRALQDVTRNWAVTLDDLRGGTGELTPDGYMVKGTRY